MEPQIKPTKLIVAMAFVRDEEGELRPAFEPREMQSEERAGREARIPARAGAGSAWHNLAATYAMTKGGLARYREEESARGPGHGTAREGTRMPKGTGMGGEISAETHYVAATMAMLALRDLSRNLAAYLAGVERVDGTRSEEGEECVRRLVEQLSGHILDTAVTDLPPGAYDAEMAKSLALDTIQTAAEYIIETAL